MENDSDEELIIADDNNYDIEHFRILKSKGSRLEKTVKGLVCAFLWPFLLALARICVQALENRSVLFTST